MIPPLPDFLAKPITPSSAIAPQLLSGTALFPGLLADLQAETGSLSDKVSAEEEDTSELLPEAATEASPEPEPGRLTPPTGTFLPPFLPPSMPVELPPPPDGKEPGHGNTVSPFAHKEGRQGLPFNPAPSSLPVRPEHDPTAFTSKDGVATSLPVSPPRAITAPTENGGEPELSVAQASPVAASTFTGAQVPSYDDSASTQPNLPAALPAGLPANPLVASRTIAAPVAPPTALPPSPARLKTASTPQAGDITRLPEALPPAAMAILSESAETDETGGKPGPGTSKPQVLPLLAAQAVPSATAPAPDTVAMQAMSVPHQPALASSVQPAPVTSAPTPVAQLEAAIEQLVEAREAGRAARPEMIVRHGEFGAITMRIEALGHDLRATVHARDPGFVPAVHAALGDRGIAATSEPGPSQQHAHSGAGGSGQNPEARYGSSPGSGQASSQPYLDQKNSDDEETSTHTQGGRHEPFGKDAPERGLFA